MARAFEPHSILLILFILSISFRLGVLCVLHGEVIRCLLLVSPRGAAGTARTQKSLNRTIGLRPSRRAPTGRQTQSADSSWERRRLPTAVVSRSPTTKTPPRQLPQDVSRIP